MADEVTIHEAKTHLSRLVQRAHAGEDIVLRRGKVLMAMLVRYDPPAIQRRPGRLRGQIELAPDCDDRRRRDGRSDRHRAVSALLADAHALLGDKLVVPEDLLQARAADGFLELAGRCSSRP